jgi:hypothetical protein
MCQSLSEAIIILPFFDVCRYTQGLDTLATLQRLV